MTEYKQKIKQLEINNKLEKYFKKLEELIEKKLTYKNLYQLRADMKAELLACIDEHIKDIKQDIKNLIEVKE